MPTIPVHQPLVLQFSNVSQLTPRPIPRQDMGREIIKIRSRRLQRTLRGFAITRLRKEEIRGLSLAIDSSEQVQPATGDSNQSFTHVPGGGFLLHVPAKPTMYLGSTFEPTARWSCDPPTSRVPPAALPDPEGPGKTCSTIVCRSHNARFKLAFPERRRPTGLRAIALPNPQMRRFRQED
jgi:hypothetical protein